MKKTTSTPAVAGSLMLMLCCSNSALAVVTDTAISGGPPNTEITLFGPDHSSTGDGAATTVKTDTETATDGGTSVQTDSDGRFQFVCTEGDRYTIGRKDGDEPDSFVCRNNGLVCLADANAITRPIIQDMPASESVGAKTTETAKGLVGGLLGGMGGGAFGGLGGGGGPKMAGKPKGPWSDFSAGDTEIALAGWVYKPRSKKKDPEIRIGIRIADSPDKGAPHMMALQNQNGDLLLPVGYMIFELWAKWTLTITVTKETYIDGELVSREVSQSAYSWKELLERYAAIIKAPAIWEQLGGDNPKAFGKLKGVIVQFPLPADFNPAEWSLITHVTSKVKPKNIPFSIWNTVVDQRKKSTSGNEEVLLTMPFIANLAYGKKKGRLTFQQAPDNLTFYQSSHDCPLTPVNRASTPACEMSQPPKCNLSAMSYSDLRTSSQQHIKEASSALWSDHNIHDPGITLMEMLCYAITDLGLRTSSSVSKSGMQKLFEKEACGP